MFFREKKSNGRSYLQVVENRWENGKCRQRVVATLGRLDKLRKSGDLESLSASAVKFSRNLTLLAAHRNGETSEITTYRVGPPMVFDRLWRDCGCRNALRSASLASKLEFNFEKAAFLMALHRLLDPEFTRSPLKWAAEYQFDATERLELRDWQRAIAWLGKEPTPSTGRVAKSAKANLEKCLLERRGGEKVLRDVAFLYVVPIRERRNARERSIRSPKVHSRRSSEGPALMGVAVDSGGLPVTYEVSWAGDANNGRLRSLIQRLIKEFDFEKVIVVADREFISLKEMVTLARAGCGYVLGARWSRPFKARSKLRRAERQGRTVRVRSRLDGNISSLKIAEVKGKRVRHVLYSEEELVAQEALDGEQKALSISYLLKRGENPQYTYQKYRRFLKISREGRESAPRKLEAESDYDGKWVLETDTNLTAAEIARRYSELPSVERLCGAHLPNSKVSSSIEESRDRTRGQACCSFLALLLAKELEDRLRRKGTQLEWNRVVRDLDRLRQIEVEYQGERYLVRGSVGGACKRAFQAVGVAMPPEVKEVGCAEPIGLDPAESS